MLACTSQSDSLNNEDKRMSSLNGSEMKNSCWPPTSQRLEPTAIAVPPKKINLTLGSLPVALDLDPVTQLSVRELKGVGQTFTANYDAAHQFHGLSYKPAGSFENLYQIVAGEALNHPRVARHAQLIAFVPAFAWSTYEVVLMPVKSTTYGRLVLGDLRKLRDQFPSYKAFVQWEEMKRRHVVYRGSLTAAESDLVTRVEWPSLAAIVETLGLIAFDSVEELSKANENIRAVISAQEV
jgi:hypothetical protein